MAFINALRPIVYHLDMDALARFMQIPDSMRNLSSEKGKAAILQSGFIAQEVEAAALKLGYDFSGENAKHQLQINALFNHLQIKDGK